MGIQREDGYSASVEAFIDVDGRRHRVAKTNGTTFSLSQPCSEPVPPLAQADLTIVVDGEADTERIILEGGMTVGQSVIRYSALVPF